jgi:hypothetical protein
MWPDFQSDARPLDTGPAPRRNTEGGIQPADKELDQPSSQALHLLLCAGILPTKSFDPMWDRSKWSVLLGQYFIS